MTERRETGRRTAKGAKRPKRPARTNTPQFGEDAPGERIAKYLARAGVASRRACETLIEEGKVTINGRKVKTPAEKVTGREDIRVGGLEIAAPERARVWRYHKPAGLITTNADPGGRRTVFDELPKSLPRLVTIGRLDLNTEGLLLLTNDGGLARAMELPGNELVRTYRARAFGRISAAALERLAYGITVDGERFGAITATLEQETGANSWLRVSLTEGRKREVRRALEAIGLKVNRLIRVSYGPFELGELKPGQVDEISQGELATHLPAGILEAARPAATGPAAKGAARSRVGRRRR